MIADCLIDLSTFDIVGPLEIGAQGEGEGKRSSLLYRRRSDGVQFKVEFIGRFESANRKGGESESEREVKKWLNLKHHCIAAQIGFAVSNAGGDAAELRAVRPYAEGGSLVDVLALPPPWWTGMAKAMAIVGLALGLRFANGVGQPHGSLRPKLILFDGAGTVQIAGIGVVRSGCRCGAEFTAPEIESGGAPTAQGDVFSFARIVSRITADDCLRGSVPKFIRELVNAGLSADPCRRPSFGAILARLEGNGFAIADGIDSANISTFIRREA
jgi:hypothetical protein